VPSKDNKQKEVSDQFRLNWRQRREAQRYYFKRGNPENQIQFAFQNHWRVFRQVLGEIKSGRVLEVGCGRGSMGAYFSDRGFELHLLDISHEVVEISRRNFSIDNLHAHYVCGDALALPYGSGEFDVVLSIGLLEHFAAIEQPLSEQVRILRPGGMFLGYVVPERLISVQTLALPVNGILRLGESLYRNIMPAGKESTRSSSKVPLYRNSYSSNDYLAVLQGFGIQETGSFGIFPLPLISHSPSFPFSLLSPGLEKWVVNVWGRILSLRGSGIRDPWTCSEGWGLAFLIWGRKSNCLT